MEREKGEIGGSVSICRARRPPKKSTNREERDRRHHHQTKRWASSAVPSPRDDCFLDERVSSKRFWIPILGGIFREKTTKDKRSIKHTHVFQLIDRIERRAASARGPRPPIATRPPGTPARLAEQPLEHNGALFWGNFVRRFEALTKRRVVPSRKF